MSEEAKLDNKSKYILIGFGVFFAVLLTCLLTIIDSDGHHFWSDFFTLLMVESMFAGAIIAFLGIGFGKRMMASGGLILISGMVYFILGLPNSDHQSSTAFIITGIILTAVGWGCFIFRNKLPKAVFYSLIVIVLCLCGFLYLGLKNSGGHSGGNGKSSCRNCGREASLTMGYCSSCFEGYVEWSQEN